MSSQPEARQIERVLEFVALGGSAAIVHVRSGRAVVVSGPSIAEAALQQAMLACEHSPPGRPTVIGNGLRFVRLSAVEVLVASVPIAGGTGTLDLLARLGRAAALLHRGGTGTFQPPKL